MSLHKHVGNGRSDTVYGDCVTKCFSVRALSQRKAQKSICLTRDLKSKENI